MKITSRCFIIWLLVALPIVGNAQFTFITNNSAITITAYTGSGGDVTVPDTINGFKVTTIGADAFNQVSDLTSVTIGTNVTTIGTNAVFQCINLASVTILGSVTNIGLGPFYDCSSLTVISLNPSNVTYSVTNNLLFNKARTSLIQYPCGIGGSYTLPAAVTNVGEAFIGNTLTSIVVDAASLFYSSTNGVLFDKNKTTLIEFPGGLGGNYTVPTNKITTTIQSAAFEYSTSVASVTIGTNITSIGFAAFYDCASLTAITVNTNNAFYSSVNGVLFDKNKTTLIEFPSALGGDYIIPGTVNDIATGAFGDALGLTSVVIPNSVTNIDFESFYNCESLGGVSIGNKVATIAQDAFFFCPALTEIVIPGSVTNIGFEAFGGCANLTTACFEGNEPTDGGSIFFFDHALSTILHVNGTTGWGSTYDGIPTAPCTTCGGVAPQLAIARSGTNVILTWSADFTGYTLQSTTNLASTAVWTTVSPAPVIDNANNTVTNSISRTRMFYRLSNSN